MIAIVIVQQFVGSGRYSVHRLEECLVVGCFYYDFRSHHKYSLVLFIYFII